jgi:HAD superfamily hydrolase (TIGR01484 family)
MQKIFFFDIDNTLLDPTTNAVPASAIQAIARLKAAGHTVAIATGRSWGHAQAVIERVAPAYSITQNGARNFKGSMALHQTPLHSPS